VHTWREEHRAVARISRGFWYGAAAGCAFVSVELLARIFFRVPTVPELVQDRLILWLPGPIFAFVLEHLLYLGKPLFFVALLVALILAGGFLGIVSARWGRPAGVALILWLVIGLLVLPATGGGVFAGSAAIALTTALAAAAYALSYCLFSGQAPLAGAGLRATRPQADPEQTAPAIDRRRLLAGGALGLVSAGLAWRSIGSLPSLPPRLSSAESVDLSGTDPNSPLAVNSAAEGVPPAVTPADRFYVVSKNLLDPQLNMDKWSLRIDGLVDHPVTLRYSEIAALPSMQVPRTLECISNDVGGDLISNGQWTGVRLADVLQQTGVQSGATYLLFTCADGYTSSLKMPQGIDPATLLVYQLDGAPLGYKHGFPVRLLGTGVYGMKNPKWITRIELSGENRSGFWQQQGWDEQGIVQTMSEITAPADGSAVKSGGTTVGGVAFAGARGINRIEVSTDSGTSWNDAQLLPALGPNTWTFWQFPWRPERAGTYSLLVRATDGTGALQSSRRTDPYPVGATGYHQVHVRVV
jgi:DMSO/TMAO reductase YedYZ molybdopterin-dependent catalytic subunit